MTPPHDTTTAKYWKSPAARAGLREEPPLPGVSRRGFLEAAGFAASLTALGGCERAPTTVVRRRESPLPADTTCADGNHVLRT